MGLLHVSNIGMKEIQFTALATFSQHWLLYYGVTVWTTYSSKCTHTTKGCKKTDSLWQISDSVCDRVWGAPSQTFNVDPRWHSSTVRRSIQTIPQEFAQVGCMGLTLTLVTSVKHRSPESYCSLMQFKCRFESCFLSVSSFWTWKIQI